jgi:hypothetical protein
LKNNVVAMAGCFGDATVGCRDGTEV